jgi:hypothetical protein
LDNVLVGVNDVVHRGQQIASIGPFYTKVDGEFVVGNYHLHYDMSPTLITVSNWKDWPGQSLSQCENNYVQPFAFTRDNRHNP